jgi:hypothetical protein
MLASTSPAWGGDVVAVGGEVYDAYFIRYRWLHGSPHSCIYYSRNSFNFIKGVLYARSSRLTLIKRI